MYLQGNLQNVFDALYHLGVIDPVLEMDWTTAMDKINQHYDEYSKIVNIANAYQENVQELMSHLEQFDDVTLSYLAMEVAREFADFHSREDLH